MPTMIVTGGHDQCTPALAELLDAGIPQSERVIFENSSHLPYIEEPDRFGEVVAEFFHRVESGATSSSWLDP